MITLLLVLLSKSILIFLSGIDFSMCEKNALCSFKFLDSFSTCKTCTWYDQIWFATCKCFKNVLIFYTAYTASPVCLHQCCNVRTCYFSLTARLHRDSGDESPLTHQNKPDRMRKSAAQEQFKKTDHLARAGWRKWLKDLKCEYHCCLTCSCIAV